MKFARKFTRGHLILYELDISSIDYNWNDLEVVLLLGSESLTIIETSNTIYVEDFIGRLCQGINESWEF